MDANQYSVIVEFVRRASRRACAMYSYMPEGVGRSRRHRERPTATQSTAFLIQMENLNPELNVCRRCAHVWRTQIQNHRFRKTTPSETPKKCPQCLSTLWAREKFTPGTNVSCTICANPAVAEAIADDLVGSLPLISIKRRRGVPLLALRKHRHLCLSGTEIRKTYPCCGDSARAGTRPRSGSPKRQSSRQARS